MATLDVTRNYADGEVLTQADLDVFLDDIETLINVTKLNDDNLQNNGITGSLKLLTGSVTAGKLATDSVSTIKIVDLNVTTAKIAASAVTTTKILDDAVTTAKIVNSAITTAKITDASVTAAKLAAGIWNDSLPAIQTSTYTVLTTDDLVRVSTGSAFTATLFANGATNSGRRIKFLKTSSDFNACTIAGGGGETVGGAASTTINTLGEMVELIYDGTSDWIIVRRYIPSVWAGATFGVTGGFSGITSQASFIKRTGDSLHCRVDIVLSGTSAASGTITLPTGIVIDTNKASSGRVLLGEWKGLRLNNNFLTAAGPGGSGAVSYTSGSTTSVFPAITGAGASGYTTVAAINAYVGASDSISFDFTIPVSGWNG